MSTRADRGPLAGVPIGVKDIFNTAGLPTEFFSSIHAGNRPSRDAAVVARLRQAGTVVWARWPPPDWPTCTGARPETRTTSRARRAIPAPGAGMAAGFFPLALGSQTAGSFLKPASFCGLFAYKPTTHLVSLKA